MFVCVHVLVYVLCVFLQAFVYNVYACVCVCVCVRMHTSGFKGAGTGSSLDLLAILRVKACAACPVLNWMRVRLLARVRVCEWVAGVGVGVGVGVVVLSVGSVHGCVCACCFQKLRGTADFPKPAL